MNATPCIRVAVGPWSVVRPLSEAVATGLPYLCLDAGSVRWIANEKERWTGTEAEARELVKEHGGQALPKDWITVDEAEARAAAREVRAEVRAGGLDWQQSPPPRERLHDRTGEALS